MNEKSRRNSMLPGSSGRAEQRPGKLDKETQVKIGQQLRAMYDEIVRQGVPDRFAELLRQLERQDDKESQS